MFEKTELALIVVAMSAYRKQVDRQASRENQPEAATKAYRELAEKVAAVQRKVEQMHQDTPKK